MVLFRLVTTATSGSQVEIEIFREQHESDTSWASRLGGGAAKETRGWGSIKGAEDCL